MKTHPKLVMAAAVSAVGLAMAAAAAMERGATGIDQALIVAVACVLALGTHLLPAVSRGVIAWTLWVACLAATAWNHATFFAGAGQRAGEVRAQAVGETGRAAALRAELDAIAARPLATVAADHAAASGRAEVAALAARCEPPAAGCRRAKAAAAAAQAKVSALADELAQARHAADLRAQITGAADAHDAARTAAAQDRVAGILSRLTGLPAEVLSTGMAVLSSLIVELLAALLWSEGLASRASQAGGNAASNVVRMQRPAAPIEARTQTVRPALSAHEHLRLSARVLWRHIGFGMVSRADVVRFARALMARLRLTIRPRDRPAGISPRAA